MVSVRQNRSAARVRCRWGQDAGTLSPGCSDVPPAGRARLGGVAAHRAAPRIAPALLLHAALLAGVIWLTVWTPQPPIALPESNFAMVFASPEASAPPAVAPSPMDPAPPPAAPAVQAKPPPVAQPIVPPPLGTKPLAPPPLPPPVSRPVVLPPPATPPAEAPPPSPPPVRTAMVPVQPSLPLPPPPAPTAPPRQVAARPVPDAAAHTARRTYPDTPPAPAIIASAPAAPPAPLIPPRPIAAVASDQRPVYPELARRRGEQGRVVLLVRVGVDGMPLVVTVDRTSGHSSLDNAAMAAVRHWRFAPATRDGRPVVSVAEIPVQFRLSD